MPPWWVYKKSRGA